MIRFMFFQHKVDHSRQLVGSRRDRHGGAMSAADAPKKCAQGAITVLQTSSGNAQSGRSPVLGRLHPSLFHFAASDAIIWAQVQPRGKVLDRGPRAHIGSNFAPKKLPRRRPSQSRVPDDIPVWWLGDANYAPYVDDRLVHTIGLRHHDKIYVLST